MKIGEYKWDGINGLFYLRCIRRAMDIGRLFYGHFWEWNHFACINIDELWWFGLLFNLNEKLQEINLWIFFVCKSLIPRPYRCPCRWANQNFLEIQYFYRNSYVTSNTSIYYRFGGNLLYFLEHLDTNWKCAANDGKDWLMRNHSNCKQRAIYL